VAVAPSAVVCSVVMVVSMVSVEGGLRWNAIAQRSPATTSASRSSVSLHPPKAPEPAHPA